MKKSKIYLDTSVVNGLFAYDAPAQKRITQQLFELIRFKKYQSYISSLVINEIRETKDPFKKTSLLDVILDYGLVSLFLTKESEDLAQKYLRQKIWTEKHKEDAEHIAIAVVNNLDKMLSWDIDDIVKETKIQQVNKINKQLGYKIFRFVHPRRLSKMTKKTPGFIEEVRKWRKKLHKETEGMSEEERIRYINEKAKKTVAEHVGKREKRKKLAK